MENKMEEKKDNQTEQNPEPELSYEEEQLQELLIQESEKQKIQMEREFREAQEREYQESLEKDLETGTRKVEKWANNIGVKTINMSFEKKDPFFNINTKEDLKDAEKILND